MEGGRRRADFLLAAELQHGGLEHVEEDQGGRSVGELNCSNSNSVQLGVTSQPVKQIAASIVAGVEQMVDLVPGKWANVQSLMLRTTNSVALPFFNALPNA